MKTEMKNIGSMEKQSSMEANTIFNNILSIFYQQQWYPFQIKTQRKTIWKIQRHKDEYYHNFPKYFSFRLTKVIKIYIYNLLN